MEGRAGMKKEGKGSHPPTEVLLMEVHPPLLTIVYFQPPYYSNGGPYYSKGSIRDISHACSELE